MKPRNIIAKIVAGALSLSVLCGMFTGCGSGKKTINIYSTGEEFRNKNARTMLTEKFPEYDINLIDISTGSLSAKLAAENPSDTDIDIIL